VAELQPPHLKAMNIDEGWTDTYRELVYHGGIPDCISSLPNPHIYNID